MTTPTPDDPVSSDPSLTLLRLLSRLAEDSGQAVGVERLKRALQSTPGLPAENTTPEHYWEWLTASAAGAGLRLTRLERPWTTARPLLSTGTLLGRGISGWLLLLEPRLDGALAYRPERDEEAELSADEIQAFLGQPSPDAEDAICWAVVQPLTPATSQVQARSEPRTPAQRLLELVRPDRGDIKLLIVFSIVVGLLNLATPVAVEALVNTVAFVGLLQPIVILALLLATCLGLAALIRILEAYVVELMQRRVFVRVATDLAYRLPRVQREALDRLHGPELVNRFFDITTVQKVGSKLLLDGVTAILSAAIGLLVLAFYHPALLAFDLLLLISLAFIVFVLGRGAVKTAIKESSAKYAVADWLEELVRHPLAFHLAGGREIALDHADTLANTYLERRGKHYRIVLRQLISALALQVVASTLLLGLGGWLVKIGQLTLGQLVASWLIVSLVLSAVAKLGRQLEGVYDLLAAADKLGLLLDLPLEGDTGESPLPIPTPARIELTDVGHTWPDGARLLHPLQLAVEPSQTVAIQGPSGSGKTTCLELIQGQRPCSQGRIELDGVDLRSLRPSAVRPQVALARPSEVISASVADNVRLGLKLDLIQVKQALEDVGLWQAVQRLPQGLETPLASFGRPLSEGQSDLLALARAIASRPRLLLVDGILDALSEEALDHVFPRLSAGPWTLIIATRRADVASRCQRALRLSDGSLTEVSA